MAKRHEGKIAVITGAGLGIGQAYAKRLAEEGAKIVIADIGAADETLALVKAAGSEGVAVKCDVSQPDDVERLARETDKAFGRCDILINNAAIYPVQTFDEITFADWRRLMSINLDALFLTVKALSGGMRSRGWGRIVNQSSDTFMLNLPGFTHYIASKGGVIGFTRALASEFGDSGVTVNSLAPGLTRTPGTSWRTGVARTPEGADDFDLSASHQAIRRKLQPEDMVGTLSFLVSDDAAFVTGQTIYVNGGATRA